MQRDESIAAVLCVVWLAQDVTASQVHFGLAGIVDAWPRAGGAAGRMAEQAVGGAGRTARPMRILHVCFHSNSVHPGRQPQCMRGCDARTAGARSRRTCIVNADHTPSLRGCVTRTWLYAEMRCIPSLHSRAAAARQPARQPAHSMCARELQRAAAPSLRQRPIIQATRCGQEGKGLQHGVHACCM